MGLFSKDPEEVREALRETGVDCPYDKDCTVIIQPLVDKNGDASLESGIYLHGNVVHP